MVLKLKEGTINTNPKTTGVNQGLQANQSIYEKTEGGP